MRGVLCSTGVRHPFVRLKKMRESRSDNLRMSVHSLVFNYYLLNIAKRAHSLLLE